MWHVCVAYRFWVVAESVVPVWQVVWYTVDVGKRTSIYLSDRQSELVLASGLTLSQVVDLGLAADRNARLEVVVRQAALDGVRDGMMEVEAAVREETPRAVRQAIEEARYG